MNGAGIRIGKILTAFRAEAIGWAKFAFSDQVATPNSALRRPRKHLEECWQLWTAQAYPLALKELGKLPDFQVKVRGKVKPDLRQADAYLCGYWRGLHDSLFLIYAADWRAEQRYAAKKAGKQ